MTSTPGTAPELSRWIHTVLGAAAFERLGGDVLTAVTLAEARSRGHRDLGAPDGALEAWSAVLRNAERALLQARVAFGEAASAAGWDSTRVAEGLGVPEHDLGRALAEAEEALRTTHPGYHRSRPPC